ncbi:helix-turn-helix domain-containing protein [Fusobacterium watanabei]|uniref:helix-turn-helix domain-containing protein n=1 Tax=Fusobacterium watanabei TaxID=2686067 RepID=UPI003B58AB3F
MYIKLKQFMLEKKIKSKDMAKILGISKSLFSKKINRKGSDFNLNEVRTICQKYNLDGNIYFFY